MDEITDALIVPQRCVMELQSAHSVYVINDSSRVESRQVVTGPKYEDYWIIESGLNANEKVVINALQKVKPGMPVVAKVTQFENRTNPQ